MSGKWGIVFSLILCVVVTGAEVVERDPFIVEAGVLPLSAYGSGSGGVAALLRQSPDVDLQVQGVSGGQTDISIRGSSFSGAGVALEGLSLPNAQTEHFHAELPFAAELFGAPRVLTGFGQSVGSAGFLVGTIDFGIQPVSTRRLLLLGVSEYDSYWGQALVQQQIARESGSVGIGGFAGSAKIHKVDFPDNDLELVRAGGQLQYRNAEGDQTDMLIGHQQKTFGVRGYYGVNPAWGGEEETRDTLIYLGTRRSRPDLDIRASAYYRETTDDYRLFWTLPGIFENNHRLYTVGGMVDGRWVVADNGWLDWRAHASEERIRSSALGRFSRQQLSLSGIPGWRLGAWQYQLGGRLDVFEEAGNEFLPQVAVTYFCRSGVSVQLAYSEAMRQPSYTELNYESPASLGNAGLQNQKAATTELLLRGELAPGLDWRAGVFHRKTTDTVDWIRRTSESARWEAENIGTLDAVGIEAGMRWVHGSGHSVALHYLGLDQSDDSDAYASRYALDYAVHLLRVQAEAAIGSRMTVGYTQNVRQQEENRLRTGSRTGYDGSLQAAYALRRFPGILLQVALDNLWDDDFEVFPGHPVYAARRYSAALRTEW